MKWFPCKSPIVADVVIWTEPIWAPPTKKRGKPDKIGEQRLTAEVLEVGEYYALHVRGVEKLSLETGAEKKLLGVKVGDNIRRKKSTLEKGGCSRMEWSDEEAREAILHSGK